MNPDTPTPRTEAVHNLVSKISRCESDLRHERRLTNLSMELERELADKTNEVARLRASLELYENMINQRDDELIRLREENAELKQGKVFVDPKWIYNLETQLATPPWGPDGDPDL